MIGRPRIEPELSSSKVTTVSLNGMSSSCLNDSADIGSMMTRVQPRRIEHAFFQIEAPGAVLLRHQAALQAVGEAADDALQRLQLLIEISAQPRQLFGVAQLFGA